MSLQLLSVTRRFGEQLALDGVSLHVQRGDCYGLIGHNGAGKTTAMRVALGLLRPDAGAVRVEGLDALRQPREARARMGGLIETPGFHAHLDAATNLFLLARLQGLARAEARRESGRLLGLAGLAEVGRKRVRDFSQGMRQRLGIAQALLGRPAYVLLDEPTNGLDPEGMAEVRALLRRLVREEGVTVLISSHQLHELAELCNRVGVMRRGRLLIEAETKELLATAPGRFEVATGDDARAREVLASLGIEARPLAAGGLALELGPRSPGEIARHLVGAGVELRRLGAQPPSLEEIYLAGNSGVAPSFLPRERQAPAWPSSSSALPETTEGRARLEPGVPGAEPERRAAPRAVWRVLRYELSCAFARWRAPGLLALPAAVAGISIALEKSRATAEAARVASGELASTTAITGFGATASALRAGLPLLAVVLTAIGSQMIAGELARGTLRNVLLRPATRPEVVAGKALAGAALALGAYLLLALVALAASAAAFGFEDLVEILPNGQAFPLITAVELRADLARALAAPLAALLGFLTLGFLAGSCTRGAANALGLAFGVLLGLDLARVVARDFGAEGWLLSAYLPTPLGDTSYLHYFADRAQGISNSAFAFGASWSGVPQDLACPVLWAVVCVALSVILLARRAVT
jgi:ABC-2 type transport system ATP-binding protein